MKRPRPPFGLREWSTDGPATALLLDARNGPLQSVASILGQVPRAGTLPSDTPVVLLGVALGRARLWRRLFGSGRLPVARALRCTALVARGYVDVAGGVDPGTGEDLAWGWSP